jgi:membrane-bound lytic murein transglycosylase B
VVDLLWVHCLQIFRGLCKEERIKKVIFFCLRFFLPWKWIYLVWLECRLYRLAHVASIWAKNNLKRWVILMLRILTLLALIVAVTVFSGASYAAQDFDAWVKELRAEAAQKGISQQTIDAALSDLKPIPRVIELDRKQPEGKMTFAQYKKRVISDARIAQGRRLYKEHRAALEVAAQKYGVPAQYIVALWGVETSYGNNTGGFKVVPALATLAHDGRRSSFFRKELFDALKIIDEGHISAKSMKGSWAGAMGQNQFMPSSFHAFAIDGNADGKRDIWGTLPDVFASTANYLGTSGWKAEEKWGRAVKVPADLPKSLTGRKNKRTLQEWKNLGVTMPNGNKLPVVAGMKAALIAPDGLSGPTFLAYSNFDVIMKWNKSTYFATSVGLLAVQIAR